MGAAQLVQAVASIQPFLRNMDPITKSYLPHLGIINVSNLVRSGFPTAPDRHIWRAGRDTRAHNLVTNNNEAEGVACLGKAEQTPVPRHGHVESSHGPFSHAIIQFPLRCDDFLGVIRGSTLNGGLGLTISQLAFSLPDRSAPHAMSPRHQQVRGKGNDPA